MNLSAPSTSYEIISKPSMRRNWAAEGVLMSLSSMWTRKKQPHENSSANPKSIDVPGDATAGPAHASPVSFWPRNFRIAQS
jgi:hypothetical protein